MPLRVLMLEDSGAEADLILHELRRGGYEPVVHRVTHRDDLLEALGEGSWQIVLLDHSLAGGEALATLASLTEFDADLPAIVISEAIGAEEAADALRAGARDLVTKGNLARLVPAVARELAQVEARRERKEGIEELRQSEQRLRLALAAGGLGSWEWDLVSGRIHWSETLELMFGLEPGAFGGSYAEFIGLVHPDDRELVGASVEEAVERDSPAVIYRALWPDGSVHWHERKSQRIRDADDRFVAMAGVTFDVTTREEAANALRESEERFRRIAEHALDLIALLDVEGRYRYLSPSCEPILGYPAGALLGTAAVELVHPDDRPDGPMWGDEKLREVRMRKADGTWLWVEGLSYQVAQLDGLHFAVIARDISERKLAEAAKELLEDELRQAQRMEAVGQLAGGIAHDFNNLLAVISGYTELLLQLGSDADGRHEIMEIGRAADRAAGLTRQLLAYSRRQPLAPSVLDLNEVVTGMQTMLAQLIDTNIGFTAALAGDLGSISADRGQIEQIIMNLVLNARDAMPHGGNLLLETANAALEDASIDDSAAAAPGDYAVLTVTDTGQGMDAETTRRIFEPFFTTKARGAGTGLGLSTVYGIAKQSGGHVEVESEPGVGTTFRLYFPQVAERAEAVAQTPTGERAAAARSETVLVVEDERALRELVRKMVETLGYTVLVAGDGVEALELAHGYPDPIQLLLTDVQMPKMGGVELAAKLSKLRPELQVVYTSGYNDNGASAEVVAGSRYVQKPYTMAALGGALRELLEPADETAS